METILSIQKKWEILLVNMNEFIFNKNNELMNSIVDNQDISYLFEDEFDNEALNSNLFKETVRDTYYYFKKAFETQKEKSEITLTFDESDVLSQIYAYAEKIIDFQNEASELSPLGFTMQYVAYMLFDAIHLNDLQDSILKNRQDEDSSIEYDVDKGNLHDVLSMLF